MSKVPAKEDTPQTPYHQKPHEDHTHHHDLYNLEYRDEDKDLDTAHHALRNHHAVPVSVSTSGGSALNDLDSILQGGIAGKQGKGSIIIWRVNEKPSPEEQEQSGTWRGLEDENEEYPEGGWKAWSVVLGSFFASFSVIGTMNTSGMSI